MKPLFRISGFFLLIILIHSCEDKPTPPTVATTAISAISYTTATSGGDATDEGGAPIVSKGVCWNTSADPTISNNKTTESGGLGAFTSNLTQLTPNTLYYVRAYATNSSGTGYGNQVSFTTLQVAVPVLTTTAVTAITQTTAISGGNITADNGSTVSARGVCWSNSQNPTTSDSKTSDGSGTGIYSSTLTGLSSNTIYYIRAYSINSIGTSYGNQMSFTTLAVVTTSVISDITSISALGGGSIALGGGASIIGRGVCWSTSYNPTSELATKTTDGAGTGDFTSSITGLALNNTYYVRAYATNSGGTSYGSERSFSTPVTDIDGNIYNIIQIGTQIWMKENLKSTKYNDGTPLTLTVDNSAWPSLKSESYCWYNNDATTYKAIYGALYNWYSVKTGKLCPAGWHVPSDSEWSIMERYLITNSFNYDGTASGNKIAKSLASVTNWEYTSVTGAVGNTDFPTIRNVTGFSAMPGGFRTTLPVGAYCYIGTYNYLWSSTEIEPETAASRLLLYDYYSVWTVYISKNMGFSVRCVKN